MRSTEEIELGFGKSASCRRAAPCGRLLCVQHLDGDDAALH
jgi:hypothetical protein